MPWWIYESNLLLLLFNSVPREIAGIRWAASRWPADGGARIHESGGALVWLKERCCSFWHHARIIIKTWTLGCFAEGIFQYAVVGNVFYVPSTQQNRDLFPNWSSGSTDWSLQSRSSLAIMWRPQQVPSVTLGVLSNGWLIQISGDFTTTLQQWKFCFWN